MADKKKKSKKQSGGKEGPPKAFQIYLDENLCNCRPILDVLNSNGIQTHLHLSHFRAGTPDSEWLQFVGSKKLVLLTTDKMLRYNEIERKALEIHNVQAFEFTHNNIGAKAMADALTRALPKMVNFRRSRRKSFVASISPSGKVTAAWGSKRRQHRRKTTL